ncbi:MAG: hypothetical protein LBI04_07305 [Treponema sp.]|jgi:hypothetical protein|nr:hypothetical protein [Treponema sp.]
MSVFCLLWVPLFFLLRRTFTGSGASGGVWALLLGSITAILQFFLGVFISPGGFGFSRWLFGFVEIVSVPVLVPLILYALLYVLRGFSGNADFANFALLWMIPVGALRAIGWSPTNDIILLIAVPLLWTALAVGIPFFINWTANNFRWYTLAISVLCILILPVLAATAYWAFFSQRTALGFLLLLAAQIPFGLSLTFDILRG